MNNGWKKARLGEVTQNFDSRRVPVREKDRRAGPYPYYGASGIVDYVDEYLYEGQYLLIAEDGENLRTRQTPIAFLADGCFWVNNHAHVVRGNDYADTRFLSYALAATDIGGYVTGSAIPKLSQASMNAIEISLPPLLIQRAIAGVLSSLDDKIEQNRRTSRSLERLAQAVFKAWFVDFEPVKAKAAGERSFPGMPQAVFDALPSRFVDSEMGRIPEGWQVGAMGDVGLPRREQIAPEDAPDGTAYIGLEHMPRRCITLNDWDTAEKVTSAKSRFRKGDILFGKLRPYFHKVGPAPVDGVCSTDIVVLFAKKPHWSAWLLMLVSSDLFVSHTHQTSAGTKMPRTNWADMARFPVPLPPDNIAAAFQDMVGPMLGLIQSGIHESRKLADLRDYLLPKLLSGKLRATDLERAVERRQKSL